MSPKRKGSHAESGRSQRRNVRAARAGQAPQDDDAMPAAPPEDRLGSFRAWCREHGVEIDDTVIDIRTGVPACASGAGWAVFAKQDVAEEHVLARVPKSAVLSCLTSSIAEVLQHVEEGPDLVLAVAHEIKRGRQGRWWGYFQSMSPREYVPMFWPEDERGCLGGTPADELARVDLEVTERDYEEQCVPAMRRHKKVWRGAEDWVTLEEFRRAASLVSSRAFYIDDEHGNAMVPVADIFNHKASVVAMGDDWKLWSPGRGSADSSDSSGGDVAADSDDGNAQRERESGASSGSDGEDETDGEDGSDRSTPDRERGEELERVLWFAAAEEGAKYDPLLSSRAGLRLHIAICDGDDGDEDVLHIVAASPLTKGSEVFNCYGELTNAQLLQKYAFTLRHNPFSRVRFPRDDFTARLAETVRADADPNSRLRRRLRFLMRHTDLVPVPHVGLSDEESDPWELLDDGRMNLAAFFALRVLFATDDEFARWTRAPDSSEHTPPLFAALDDVLERRSARVREELGSAAPEHPSLQLRARCGGRDHVVDMHFKTAHVAWLFQDMDESDRALCADTLRATVGAWRERRSREADSNAAPLRRMCKECPADGAVAERALETMRENEDDILQQFLRALEEAAGGRGGGS
ncbi:unnamed protein product [Pedinophyceae sp. YPF-701]|nr:unnamed protein product [Pedinophyceae sp. YPF-701]